MIRSLLPAAAVLALLAPPAATAQEKKPVRLFAEAEDFTVTSPGWKVLPYRENYFAGTSGVAFLSRMACLSAPDEIAPGKRAVAEQAVTIPYEDTFEVMVRYEQPFQFAAEFTIEVEQNGQVAGRFPCGRLTDPKVWAFNGHKRVAMERHPGGGGDNIVWQQPGRVKLAAGAAKLRLIAAEQADGDKPRVNIARRNVDVVCLTNDAAGVAAQKATGHLEFDGWLVQDGDAFVRFTNPKDAAAPVVRVAPFDQGQHSPRAVHVRDWPTQHALKSGRAVPELAYQNAGPRATKVKPEALAKVVELPKGGVPDGEFLQPGDTSGWVPLGPALDALNDSQWFPKVIARVPAGGVYLRVEFGIPDGRGGVKVIKDVTVRGPAQNLSPACFDVPGCVNPNPDHLLALLKRYWKPEVRTQQEVLEYLRAEVAKFPKVGSPPRRMPFYGIMGPGGALDAFPGAKQLALALGDRAAADAAGTPRERVAHWGDPSPGWIKTQEAARPGGFEGLAVVSYGAGARRPAAPLTDDEFAAWLKAKGVTFDGPVTWTADRAAPLFYYAQAAALEAGAARYAAGTAYYKSKGVLTAAGGGPGANDLVTETDHVRPFQLKALSLPWAEGPAGPVAEFSPQVVGYLATGLRAGAKYDGLPVHMRVAVNSPGQIPTAFRQSYYAAIAHGAKAIHYTGATPSAVGAGNSVASYDLKMWKEVHTCTHEAGVFEDYVLDGQVRPAKVGLLLSATDELITGVTDSSLAVHNNERKALYYALRHAQVPVDFLSEDDVIEGRARDYKLIYVTQQYLRSAGVDALQKWCELGGTVVAMAGGGYWNEFQKENPAAAKLYGATGSRITTDPNLVSRYLLKDNVPFLSKQDLPQYEPLDMVQWHIGGLPKKDPDPNPSPNHVFNVPVLVWKQPLAATDGTVIGKFKDGSPAVVAKAHGKGKSILFGFLPGQAYLQSALPVRPVDRGATADSFAHFLPTGMRLHLLPRLTDDLLGAGGRDAKPVVTTDGLVETTCIDTPAKGTAPARLAVPLINWSGAEATSLTVTIRGLDRPSKVRSLERGELAYTQVKGGIQITMPLNVADMLLIDR